MRDSAFAFGAGRLRFKFWVGQIGHSVPTARHCDLSSKEATEPAGANDAEMGTANSLHASAQYSEYNDLIDLTNRNTIAVDQNKFDTHS